MICFKCLSLTAIGLSINPSRAPEHEACDPVARGAYSMCVPMRHVESMGAGYPFDDSGAEVDGRDGARSIASRALDT